MECIVRASVVFVGSTDPKHSKCMAPRLPVDHDHRQRHYYGYTSQNNLRRTSNRTSRISRISRLSHCLSRPSSALCHVINVLCRTPPPPPPLPPPHSLWPSALPTSSSVFFLFAYQALLRTRETHAASIVIAYSSHSYQPAPSPAIICSHPRPRRIGRVHHLAPCRTTTPPLWGAQKTLLSMGKSLSTSQVC